jgi:hypothetical protein
MQTRLFVGWLVADAQLCRSALDTMVRSSFNLKFSVAVCSSKDHYFSGQIRLTLFLQISRFHSLNSHECTGTGTYKSCHTA